jgi:hypothetical protein
MPETKLYETGMYFMASEPISTAYFINPFISNTNITASQIAEQPYGDSNVT